MSDLLKHPHYIETVFLTEKLVVHYFHAQRIVYMQDYEMSRASTDAFADIASVYFDRCIKNRQPALYIYEAGGIGLTPYSKDKMEAFIKAYQHVRGRGGYIFARNPLTFVVRRFVMQWQREQWPYIDFRPFKNASAAMQWLESGLLLSLEDFSENHSKSR